MARRFNASNEYLEISGTPPISTYPFVMFSWFNNDSAADSGIMASIVDKDVGLQMFGIRVRGDVAGDPCAAFAYDASALYHEARSSTGYSAGTWHSCTGLFVSATSRSCVIDGGSKGSNTTSVSPINLDRYSIGRVGDVTPGNYWDGNLAEVAIWDISVWPGATAADKMAEFEKVAVPALASGFSPAFFLLGLKSYHPLGGLFSPNDADRDVLGVYNMTAFNAPTTADHPNAPSIIYPSTANYHYVLGAAPPSFAGSNLILGGGVF